MKEILDKIILTLKSLDNLVDNQSKRINTNRAWLWALTGLIIGHIIFSHLL